MKLNHIAIYLVLATVGANKFEHWSSNDIEFFLDDRGVNYDSDNRDGLVTLAEEEFAKLKKENSDDGSSIGGAVQHILSYVTGNYKVPQKWDFLTNTAEEAGEQASETATSIKEWIFNSWSKANLQSFLKENKIKFKKSATKSDLVSLAQEHYEEIAKKAGSSGFYPGSWIYSSWSVEDLKKWLADNDLTFDNAKDTKDDLVAKVKNNNYLASLEYQDAKKSLFDSLSLGESEIFDKSGKVTQSFVDSWSYSQLREWLYYQGFIDTKPGVNVENLDKEKLQKIVLTNQKYLADDIKSWSDEAAKVASPYLDKGADAAKDAADKVKNAKEAAEEVINDTFLIGVEKWDKARLRQFLEVRGVKIPTFATHKHLVKLVQTHTNSPLAGTGNKNEIFGSWFTENLSTQTIRDWLKSNGQSIEGSRKDLIKKLEDYIESGQVLTEDVKQQIQEQIASHKPNVDEYRTFATKAVQDANKKAKDNYNSAKKAANEASDDAYQKYDEATSLADESILQAYKVGNEYYDTAAKLISEKLGSNQKKLVEALNEAKKASYDYAVSFSNDVSDTANEVKPNLDQAVKSAQVEGTSYANYVVDVISSKIDDIQETGEAAGNALSEFWDQANEYFHKILKPKASEVASDAADAHASATGAAGNYASHAQSIYSQASKYAGEYAAGAQDAVQNAYGSSKVSSGDYVDLAQEHLNSVYNSFSSGWSNFWTKVSDSDLKAYLRSFGYSSKFLNNINHDQLHRLAQQQTDFYFGTSNLWDRPISEIISDKFGFKKEKSTLEKIKEAVKA